MQCETIAIWAMVGLDFGLIGLAGLIGLVSRKDCPLLYKIAIPGDMFCASSGRCRGPSQMSQELTV